jgi:hypothetical protein
MTDYCSLDDALALIPSVGTPRDAGTGNTATVPSATQAKGLLTLVSGEIDMHLRGRGYALPIIDPDALESLASVCANGTAARIAKAKWPAAAGPGGDGGVAADLRTDYLAGLAFIDSGGLGIDVHADLSVPVFADGFKDSEGTHLCVSKLVTRTTRETEF